MIRSKEMFMQMREEESKEMYTDFRNSIVDYTKRNDEVCKKCLSLLDKDGECIKCLIERNERGNF